MRRATDWLRSAFEGWTLRDWLLWLGIAGAVIAVAVQVVMAARRG